MSDSDLSVSEQRLKEWIRRVSAALGIFIFVVAVYFIHRFSKQYSWDQIVSSLHGIPIQKIVLSVLATMASYAVLSLYDLLALRYVGQTLSWGKSFFTSLIAFALSNNIGLANLAGNSVRFRVYSHFGFRPVDILALVVFISFSFWTGFLGLAGAVFLFSPPDIPNGVQLTSFWIRVLGFFLFLIPIVYYLACQFRWSPKFLKRMKYELPSGRVALEQIAVSAGEWSLAALALYVLLPPSAGGDFVDFLSVFGMAQFLGLVSHVPGGIGVLEATVLFFVSGDDGPSADAIGALLAFRIIYYFMPMILSLVALAIYEIIRKVRPRPQ